MSGRQDRPQPLRLAPPTSFDVPAGLLVEGLTLLAAADSTVDVAAACLPALLDLPGVRGAAVVRRSGRDVVVLGSAGYACGVMAPGARLPLDAGLPVTEAVRSGRPVSQGAGPGWMAAPFGWGTDVAGAVLLSLEIAPAEDPAALARLGRLADGLGAALRRTVGRERTDADLALVTRMLAPEDVECPSLETAVRRHPLDGAVGGDVVVCVDDGYAVWLLAADVCGSGLSAALVASAVRAAVQTAVPTVASPAALLTALDAGLRSTVGPESFVTAAAVRLAGGVVQVASAGHPLPLLLGAAGPVALAVEPGPPLALSTQPSIPIAEATWTLPPAAVLLLHTDGLTDRRTAQGVRMLDPAALCTGIDTGSLQDAADTVLAAADAVAPASDDVSLLLVRLA